MSHRYPHEFGKVHRPFPHCIREFLVQAGDVQSNTQIKDVFAHAETMGQQGMPLSKDLMYRFLQKSIENKEMDAARRAHSIMVSSRGDYGSVLDDRLIHLFALCGSLFEANLVFCLAAKPSCHTWHAIISAHAGLGCNANVFYLFGQMQCKGIKPSKVTLLCVLRICTILTAFTQTILIHGLIIDSKFEADVVIGNALLDTYAKCGSFMDAHCVFEKLNIKDVISHNSMMAGYALHEQYFLAFECFCKMQEAGIEENEITYSCIFKVCGALEALEQGRLIHEKLLRSDVPLDVVINNTLIDMYARCGSLEDAHKVFDNFPDRNVVSWGAMIAGCTLNGHDLFALELYGMMQQAGMTPDRISYISVLQACGGLGAVGQGMLIHTQSLHCSFESDVVIGSSLVDMYARCACLDEALKVFHGLQGRNLVSWNAMIAGYVQHEHPALAIHFFERMQRDGIRHDEVTCTWVLKACGSVRASKQGHWIHDHVIRSGLESKKLIETSLIDMYVKLESLEGAQTVFNRSCSPSSHVWNAMIAGYADHKQCVATIIGLVEKMQEKSLSSNEFTLSCISKACASIKAVEEGKLLHDQTIRLGIDSDVVIGNGLISMYSEFGDLMAAEKVFMILPIKNVVSWNSVIMGYTRHGFDFLAIELFEKLQQANQSPDNVTFLSILKACGNVGSIEQGKIIHDLIIRSQIGDDLNIGSALIDMYAKCGVLYCAWKVFHNMPKRNVVSWGALIHGYSLYGFLTSCKQCLQDMQGEGLKPDGRIYTSILAACSHTGLVEEGRQQFKAMQEVYGLNPSMEVCNCMIDLLCRAGCLREAKELLCTLPISPDIFGWMSLFTACRIHGNRELARLCFDRAVHLDPDMAGGYIAMLNVNAECQLWDDVRNVQDLWKSIGSIKKPARAWVETDSKVYEFVALNDEVSRNENVSLVVKLESLKRQMMHHGYAPQLDFLTQTIY